MLSAILYFYNVLLTPDVILVFTYTFDGYYSYAFITVCLVLGPTIVVQVFSARWHIMDELFDKATMIIHTVLLGVLHRCERETEIIRNNYTPRRSWSYV